MNRTDLYSILEAEGIQTQSLKLMEECGELIQAIAKYYIYIKNMGDKTESNITISDKTYVGSEELLYNIKEEIADVEIMLAQIKMFLNCDEEVSKIQDVKIKRYFDRCCETVYEKE